MRAVKNINIPEPCHQPWELMDSVEGGRHCESCCKTVTDFTGMTDVEVINYFTVKNNVCGRFSDDQLNRVNLKLSLAGTKARAGRKKWIMTAAMLVSTIFYKATGQSIATTPKVEQTQGAHPGKAGRNGFAPKDRGRIIEGRILDDACMPLAGATLLIVGTNISLPTEADGTFKFHSPKTAKQFTVSYVGFETVTVNIDNLQHGACDLNLTPQVISMHSVMVVSGQYSERRYTLVGAIQAVSAITTKKHCWLWRMYYKYIRTPIHNIFYVPDSNH